jgi:hypothetical protein
MISIAEVWEYHVPKGAKTQWRARGKRRQDESLDVRFMIKEQYTGSI